MSLELMRKWFNSLPESEKDLPLLHVGNAFYTPRQALYEVERGTKIGEQLQRLVEEGRFGTDLNALAKARLLQVLEKTPYKIGTLTGKAYSPEELAEMLQKGELTPELKLLMETEIELAKRTLGLAKKVAGGE